MARKPVLTGGKRDEIIAKAMMLFFENGYEGTSVRMIMDQVGGEIGMFYHYFKSKEELFDKVVEAFFRNYEEKFSGLIRGCSSPEELVNVLLPVYERSMQEFGAIQGNMHWTIQYAMNARTLAAFLPVVAESLTQWGIKSETPPEILAGQLLYGISATIHSKAFETMDGNTKKETLLSFMGRVLAE